MNGYETYNKEKFRENIEYYQLKQGITQKELQEKIGVGKVYLSRLWAKDSQKQPSIQVVRNLSLLFGVSMETLLYRTIKEFNCQFDEKQKKFIDKVLENTREGKLMWEKFSMAVEYEESTFYDLYSQAKGDESVYIFTSKYGRSYSNNILNKSSGYKVRLETGVELILVELLYDRAEDHAYELYIANAGKCIKCCTNESIEDEVFKGLNTLWRNITIDSEKLTLDKIYDNYLNFD